MEDRGDIPKGISMEQAAKLAQSEAGQALLANLQSQHGDTLQSAIAQAQAGNYTQVKKTLAALLNSPEGKSLLRQLRGQQDG